MGEYRTKLIADIGSNWSTDDEAKAAVIEARNVGFDIVKFQFFDSEGLYGPGKRIGEPKFPAIESG